MNNIEIIETGIYLPKPEVSNDKIEKRLGLEDGYIRKRTGIEKRFYSIGETIEKIALKAVNNLFEKNISKEGIGLIITATTTTNNLMPGISNYIQKHLKIEKCIALDILAGCSGYINAFDIAKMYIETGRVEKALIIGVDILSRYIDVNDVSTSVVLSDGAGATLIEKSKQNKKYFSLIEAEEDNNEILTCKSEETIKMNGKEVYKYAVTDTTKNILDLLEKSNEKMEDIKYIIPHQSNLKIMNGIANRLKIDKEKMYVNIDKVGNTFCASIPIAIDELKKEKLLKSSDKIILLGYGGGLNTGSILLEI